MTGGSANSPVDAHFQERHGLPPDSLDALLDEAQQQRMQRASANRLVETSRAELERTAAAGPAADTGPRAAAGPGADSGPGVTAGPGADAGPGPIAGPGADAARAVAATADGGTGSAYAAAEMSSLDTFRAGSIVPENTHSAALALARSARPIPDGRSGAGLFQIGFNQAPQTMSAVEQLLQAGAHTHTSGVAAEAEVAEAAIDLASHLPR